MQRPHQLSPYPQTLCLTTAPQEKVQAVVHEPSVPHSLTWQLLKAEPMLLTCHAVFSVSPGVDSLGMLTPFLEWIFLFLNFGKILIICQRLGYTSTSHSYVFVFRHKFFRGQRRLTETTGQSQELVQLVSLPLVRGNITMCTLNMKTNKPLNIQ